MTTDPDAIDTTRPAPSVAPPRQSSPFARHLVIVYQPGWQDPQDWVKIAGHVRRLDPTIGVFIMASHRTPAEMIAAAATRPSLVFSPGPLVDAQGLRGKAYHGAQINKFTQIRLLHEAGVRVPLTDVLRPDTVLDPARWGDLVIVKPTDYASSSKGAGIQLMRTSRVRYIAPEDYPEDHPGRKGPMVVQRYIDTGEHVETFRVLTLFGTPLYVERSYSRRPRVPLDADDATLEASVVAIQTEIDQRVREFVYDADIVATARQAHAAMPEIPLKGVDILRDVRNGAHYVIEVNPNSNTWHFSSAFLAEQRASFPPEFNERRLTQLDAFGTTAHVLTQITRREAE